MCDFRKGIALKNVFSIQIYMTNLWPLLIQIRIIMCIICKIVPDNSYTIAIKQNVRFLGGDNPWKI